MNRYGSTQFQFSMTPTVKWLLILTLGIWFFFQVLLEQYFQLPFGESFSLVPYQVFFQFHIWRPLTYIFLHTYSVSHIAFNMLMLWMIGTELEQKWGRRYFLFFYLTTGVGAAFLYCLGQIIYYWFVPDVSSLMVPVMGASGSLFGLMIAYGMLFGERIIHVMMIFPMKAKHFVMILGAIEVASLLTSQRNGGGVAYLAHLGGLLSGFLVLKGTTWWQRQQIQSKAKKRGRNLRLVVDNEDEETKKSGPKYWN